MHLSNRLSNFLGERVHLIFFTFSCLYENVLLKNLPHAQKPSSMLEISSGLILLLVCFVFKNVYEGNLSSGVFVIWFSILEALPSCSGEELILMCPVCCNGNPLILMLIHFNTLLCVSLRKYFRRKQQLFSKLI